MSSVVNIQYTQLTSIISGFETELVDGRLPLSPVKGNINTRWPCECYEQIVWTVKVSQLTQACSYVKLRSFNKFTPRSLGRFGLLGYPYLTVEENITSQITRCRLFNCCISVMLASEVKFVTVTNAVVILVVQYFRDTNFDDIRF